LAILSERSFIAKKIISPIISIIRALPTIAVVLLLLFWTNSFVAPIIVTMLVVLPTLYVNLTSAISSVDKNLLEMCYFYNVEKKQVLKKVIVPCILPQTLTAMGAGISLNLKLMVAAEVLASTAKSIGGLLNYTNSNLQTAKMIALVVITVILALIIEKFFNFFSLKVGKWQ
jgi:NitT/TauT family transport system permease protein